jgi:choline-glycine betaine transporter
LNWTQFVQSLGYYFQSLVRLGFHTDAFEQLGHSASAAYRRFVPEGFEPPDGPDDWIDAWTMFYWGWWISWSPFVGMIHFLLFR